MTVPIQQDSILEVKAGLKQAALNMGTTRENQTKKCLLLNAKDIMKKPSDAFDFRFDTKTYFVFVERITVFAQWRAIQFL